MRFNTNDERIQYLPRMAVNIIPVSLVLLGVVHLFHVGTWLALWFNIDVNSPLQAQPNSTIFLVCAFSILVVMVIGGVLLGWILNGVVLFVGFKWPLKKVIGLLWYLETPPEWLEDDMENGTKDSDAQDFEDKT